MHRQAAIFQVVPGRVSRALLGGAGRGATGGSSQERRGGRRSCFSPKICLGPNIEQNGLSLGLETEYWGLEIEHWDLEIEPLSLEIERGGRVVTP